MLTPALRQRAEEHINALGRRHRVRIHRTKTWGTSEADPDYRQVWIPARIRTGMDYLTSLHELGHVIDPGARRVRPGHEYPGSFSSGNRQWGYDCLVMEAAAWAWAIKVAVPSILRTLTPAEWSKIGKCWASHAGDIW